jgi:molybdopterin-biosynthesis enzyme MoeA-like protein
MPDKNPTACLLVIGNEVLSGRTQDANIRFLAKGLGEIGIPLREVRVIPDVPATIISTVNEVRAKFDFVFTTGGIGRRMTTSPANACRRVRRAVGAASGCLGAHGALL